MTLIRLLILFSFLLIFSEKKIKSESDSHNSSRSKKQTVSKSYCCKDQFGKAGLLLEQFGNLKRKLKDKTSGGMKDPMKILALKDAAETIKNAIIYPYEPMCTKIISEEDRKNITDTYTALSSCPLDIKNACNDKRISYNGIDKKNECSVNALEEVIGSLKDLLGRRKCTKRVNILQLKMKGKICKKIIDPYAHIMLKVKKKCDAIFLRCEKLKHKGIKLLASCVGGKPENTKPNKIKIGEIRKGQISLRRPNLLTIEMDIYEHGQFFTQTTTYDQSLRLLKVHVPTHGYDLNKIVESTTYLLQTNNSKSVFDTEIVIIGNNSYIGDVSIDIEPIVKVLNSTNNKNIKMRAQNIKTKQSETLDSIIETVDITRRHALPEMVKNITTGTNIIKVTKHTITESDRYRLKLGDGLLTNTTHIRDLSVSAEHTNENIELYGLRTQGYAQQMRDCFPLLETAHLQPQYESKCTYTLSIKDDSQTIYNDHRVTTYSNRLTCCDDYLNTMRYHAWPATCHCSYIKQSWTTNYHKCASYDTSKKHCCKQKLIENEHQNFPEDHWNLVGVTGPEEYGCINNCLYQRYPSLTTCMKPGSSLKCSLPSDDFIEFNEATDKLYAILLEKIPDGMIHPETLEFDDEDKVLYEKAEKLVDTNPVYNDYAKILNDNYEGNNHASFNKILNQFESELKHEDHSHREHHAGKHAAIETARAISKIFKPVSQGGQGLRMSDKRLFSFKFLRTFAFAAGCVGTIVASAIATVVTEGAALPETGPILATAIPGCLFGIHASLQKEHHDFFGEHGHECFKRSFNNCKGYKISSHEDALEIRIKKMSEVAKNGPAEYEEWANNFPEMNGALQKAIKDFKEKGLKSPFREQLAFVKIWTQKNSLFFPHFVRTYPHYNTPEKFMSFPHRLPATCIQAVLEGDPKDYLYFVTNVEDKILLKGQDIPMDFSDISTWKNKPVAVKPGPSSTSTVEALARKYLRNSGALSKFHINNYNRKKHYDVKVISLASEYEDEHENLISSTTRVKVSSVERSPQGYQIIHWEILARAPELALLLPLVVEF